MKKKKLVLAEILGVFIVIAGALFLQNLYELTGKSTLGVVFGSVNQSVWEKAKCASIAYFLYGLIELMCVKPWFRRFVVSKAFGLSVTLGAFLIAGAIWGTGLVVLLGSVGCGLFSSYLLYVSGLSIGSLFAPACFLLMLIFMMTFSFTAFPPRIFIFEDPMTGYYGVLPQSFDMGAVLLAS